MWCGGKKVGISSAAFSLICRRIQPHTILSPQETNPTTITASGLWASWKRGFALRLNATNAEDDHVSTLESILEHRLNISAAYFQFNATQQQHVADMLNVVSAYATGSEDAVKARGGQAATLLLEHLAQQPIPIIEQHEHVSVDRE
jgi:hypothetical protein